MALPAVRSFGPLGRWDSFQEFEDIYRQMGRWMDSVNRRLDDSVRAWSPSADVTENDEAYLVEVELPGVKREDITIDLVGSELAISGELKEKERQGLFRHRTRRTGQFSYQVTLPRDVNADKVEASLAEGVLAVRVPKNEAAKPRRIAISGK
ncbi:Hsp20/alpha crystallin family protein [Actinophytocola gossypii]|uniref:Hsp20/alpha crystallin family protein n=1 Tax=Actinophytocola gossypii TaxID=2812003 RepID=A0ABT2JA04_9PSEU|nr:Hsp20/alpha crystallin family protein [Actinophytocola gossypii]MCT2584598.1 Hsp20/alpha crystallin family protein [Actinophytocola gossypii]